MGKAKVTFDGAKGMLYNGLPPFIILWVLFDVVIIDLYCILVLAALYNAFIQFGALAF